MYKTRKQNKKLWTKRTKLVFLKRCRDHNILPGLTRFSYYTKTNSTRKVPEKKPAETFVSSRTRLWSGYLISAATLTPCSSQNDRPRNSKNWSQGYRKKMEQQKICNSVKNLSSQRVSDSAENVPSKGFNYTIAPRHIPIEDCNLQRGSHNTICTVKRSGLHQTRPSENLKHFKASKKEHIKRRGNSSTDL